MRRNARRRVAGRRVAGRHVAGRHVAGRRAYIFPDMNLPARPIFRDAGWHADLRRRVVAAAALALAAACASDATSGPSAPPTPTGSGRYASELFAGVTTTANLAYGSSTPSGAGAPATLRLDLFEPAGDTASNRPLVVLVHGGGFISGNRNDANLVELARRLARRGFVTASISYRLRSEIQAISDPVGTIRDAVDDAKAAVRWLRSQAATYRLDVTRFAIGGASAGGFTAMGVAYLEGEGNSGTPGESSAVRAVASFWGGMLDVNELEAGEAPVFLVHGTADAVVPYSASTSVQARAQAVGVPVELRTMTGAGHTHWLPMGEYVDWFSAFLRLHLALP